MKAQARKILALIMAMVMCLSLAAPAFAEAEEAAEAPEASTSEVVEEEAPKTEKKEEKELDVQAAVTEVTSLSATNTVLTVETKDAANATATQTYDLANGTDQLPDWITCTVGSQSHVGEGRGRIVYVVNVANGYTDGRESEAKGKAVPVTIPGDNNDTVKLTDEGVAQWETLPESAVYPTVSRTTYKVQGKYWEEKQDDGTYHVFFKLDKVVNNAFQTGDDDCVYFRTQTPVAKPTASTLGSVLAGAKVYNVNTNAVGDAGITAAVGIETSSPAATAYTYNVINAEDVVVSAANAASITFTKVADDKETGTFQVSVKATTDGKDSYLSSASEVEAKVKEQLKDKCEVVSVVAASGNYFTVTVKANAKSAAPVDTTKGEKAKFNKAIIVWNNGTEETPNFVAGLYDIDEEKGGFYNGKDADGADGVQIAKGTELLGPVAVKASDVTTAKGFKAFATPTETGDGYYVFNSVEEMKEKIKLDDCKESKTVSYTQLVMNQKNGTKVNGLVNVTAYAKADLATPSGAAYSGTATATTLYVVEPQTYAASVTNGWYVPNSIAAGDNKNFVKTGSFTAEAANHNPDSLKTTTEVTKEPTCQEDGEEVTKTICTDCGAVIGTPETKTIPKNSDPVEINKTKNVPSAEDPSTMLEQVYFATHAAGGHWIKEAKVTTEPGATATETIKVTTYTCNYGVVHSELTRRETVKKANLQHSGKWNLGTWGTKFSDPKTSALTLYGNTLEIADSDIDDATLPLNRTTPVVDAVFKFEGATDMQDGTFCNVATPTEVNVYTSNSTLPTKKTYTAILTVKDIVKPKYVCTEGSATIEATVYEFGEKYNAVTDAFADPATDKVDAEKLAKALADGKVTKVGDTYTKSVVIGASSAHLYTGGATVCDVCGTSREAAQNKSQIFTVDTIEVSDLDWTGVAAMPKVVVKDVEGNMLIEDVDYIKGVEDKNATDVGTYTCVIKGTGDYTGNRISKTYNINKVAATLKKKSAPKTLTASATKKVTGQIKMTVKGGKVSAYKVTGKVSGVSVNKSGKITVKKGNKKAGTLKVKVSMKADKNHTAAKAVTIKVAIKAAPAAKKTTKKK